MTTAKSSRHALWYFLALAIAIGVFISLGPKNSFGPETPTVRPASPGQLSELDSWLAHEESRVDHLRQGTEKEIVWFSTRHEKTPWSVVYIHGFSASKLETAPLSTKLASALHANAFYTRLTGHGQASTELGNARVQDWMADINEAMEIGSTIGDKVLVVSCSTGSTLATWFGLSPNAQQAYAHVFISPNFGPKDKRAEMINWPWGQQIAYAVQGESRGVRSDDPKRNLGWTNVYPTKALFPMMALTLRVRDSNLSQFKQPVLVFYSEQDQVVDPEMIKHAFASMANVSNQLYRVDDSESDNQHVLVGDIYAPKSVEPMVNHIVKWLPTISTPSTVLSRPRLSQ